MIDNEEFWAILGALGFLSGFIYLVISVYLAVKRNPKMDQFLYNDERFSQAIAAGGIPFGVMRVFEYGLCFILCRFFNLPVTKFFRNAKQKVPDQSTILYELNIVFALLFFMLLGGGYFFDK